MSLTRKPRKNRYLRMSALRQALVYSVCLLFLQLAGALIAELIIQVEFANRLKLELRERFEVIAAEIERNGFHPENYPRYNGEIVYFQADPDSAATAPAGIFELRGAVDDDFWEDEVIFNTDFPENDWYYFIGEAAGSVLAIGTNLAYSSLFHDLVPITFVTVGAAVSLIALAFGLAYSLRTQKRLNRISGVLGRISQGELTSRVASERSRDDLDDLADDIDRTLDRLEELFNQTRNLAVNIAHDLKTPLARLRLRLENALAADSEGVGAPDVEEALNQADHIIAVFEAILRIARLESGSVRTRFGKVSLEAVARETAATFCPVAEDRGYGFELRAEGDAEIQGDAVLLAQMLTNLIENAMRHTPEGTKITVVVRDGEIGIADNGPGIPPDAYAEVVKPSVRLDASRSSQGAGLGLALVKTIAEVHGAELVLSDNPFAWGRGLYVRAQFS